MSVHNSASKQDIASLVIMPGDPLRAEWIARTYFTNPRLINNVRNMLAFTGEYQGRLLTVMGHGMGMPSAGIYFHELFAPSMYDVQKIIRVGSAGACVPELEVNDVVLVSEAFSDSNYLDHLGISVPNDRIFKPDCKWFAFAQEKIKQLHLDTKIGRVYSSDVFYDSKPIVWYQNHHIDVVEMETAGLFALAKKFNKSALSVLTVSDSLLTNKELSSEERQKSFSKMMSFVLDVLITD